MGRVGVRRPRARLSAKPIGGAWRAALAGVVCTAFGCMGGAGPSSREEAEGLGEVAQPLAPVGAGFTINAGDLRFILRQIQIAQAHAGGGQLFGPGPNQVNDPRVPWGLRTVDGSFNHLVPGQERWGSADQVFPRLTPAHTRPATPRWAAWSTRSRA